MLSIDEKIRLAKEAGTELDKIKLMVNIYNDLYAEWVIGGRCDEIIHSKLTTSAKTIEAPSGGTKRRGLLITGGCSAHTGRNGRLEKEQRNPPHHYTITSAQASEAF